MKEGFVIETLSLPPHSALIIAGPTASGKSGLAMALGKQHDGVIINADSQQIYKGLPILSAQPDADDMAEVPHRLYSFLDGADICDAHRWRELAKKELDDVLSKGELPILVGGTGLYINALVDGLSPVPDIPDDIRAETMRLLDDIGIEALYKRLKDRDAEMAARLDPTNKRRVARAWEVIEATGKSLAKNAAGRRPGGHPVLYDKSHAGS